ncbi:MAG: thiol reductant ABC exporter subunit CydC [Rhodovulum sulfidophilum]|uniref:Thiol reductant ABC exporter subunit CydC n=1 Tax=Rhodovulum sulfidophilum TaxID=35806 RepID=A0A2W5Q714_RHOSU|nr:MAG: thiol reductant ABC exporter subunit CydC [Rhodovulum sulfidophilum]
MKDLVAAIASGHRRRFLLGLALSAATVLAGLALLGLSGWFITATGIAGLSAATAFAFDVFAPAAGIRLLAILRTAARYGERLTTHDATLASLAGFRARLFRGLARPGAAEALRLRPARMLFRLTLDVDALDALYLRGIVPAVALGAAALGLGLALGPMDWRLGLAGFAALIAVGLVPPLRAARAARRPVRARARLLETLRGATADLVRGQTDLLMAGRLDAAAAGLARADARLAARDRALDRIEGRTGAALALGGAALLAGALIAVAALAERGAIGAPVAALGILVALGATEPFAALRRASIELGRATLAARRLGPRLADAPAPAGPSAPRDPSAVRLEAVTARHYGAARPVLTGLSLEVASGERVAVVGPSGSGKSTLIALIAGALGPEAGRVEALPATLLTQRTELFRDSLRDNLRLAAPEATDDELAAALATAGLGATVAALPEGLDTRLGEGGLGLSGGQARRLALARAILRDTPLWLLDEPTDGLDAATAADVLTRLGHAATGKSLVVATHIRREAALCDRLLALADGRLVATARRGTPAFDTLLAGLRPD